ncbi:MAG TPA: glycosyltransferase family 2 protein [Flavobacterium sp.]|nr:glycosyltransferase family 2 protein [Flavobacterium sp.]
MNHGPFFSVITAAYNSSATIGDTLASLLSQDFTDFEYIIVDGASKDTTVDIVKKYVPLFESKGIRLRWISEPDRGIYDAWNKGVRLAEGRWISFIGSDDTYVAGALHRYKQMIDESDAAVNYISSRVEVIDHQKKTLRVFGSKYDWRRVVADYDVAQVGSFHRKTLFEEVGPFSEAYRIAGDLQFYIRCRDVIRPSFFPEITARMLDGGVSNQPYPALREGLRVKLDTRATHPLDAYFHFYLSLTKCYVKMALRKLVGIRA